VGRATRRIASIRLAVRLKVLVKRPVECSNASDGNPQLQEKQMRRHRRIVFASAVASALAGCATLAGAPAFAAAVPTASISIQAVPGALTVELVAQSRGFASKVTSYTWSFGDGGSAQTAVPHEVHTYLAPGSDSVSVTETDAAGQTASASGTLELAPCPVGTAQCQADLQAGTGVSFIQASGPIDPRSPAEVNLFSGSYRFKNCDLNITPAGSLTDSGFTGPLTVLYTYTPTNPKQVNRTCFASTVKFVDASGRTVNSGTLPSCQSSRDGPPCVESTKVSGTVVTKELIIPPGDPKFGS
jgi:hypothetical protein